MSCSSTETILAKTEKPTGKLSIRITRSYSIHIRAVGETLKSKLTISQI